MRGSTASRSASPNSVKPSVATASARLDTTTGTQLSDRYWELRYDHGELKTRVDALAPAPGAPPRTTHFGFEAPSRRAVEELRAAFKAAGVPETEWQEAGPVRVQVFDPDGYRVEAYAWD